MDHDAVLEDWHRVPRVCSRSGITTTITANDYDNHFHD